VSDERKIDDGGGMLYPVYTIEQTSSWLIQLTHSSSSS